LNGMTVPVVKWLGEQIIQFDQAVRDGTGATSYEQPAEKTTFAQLFDD
jgi:hypothetical protein